MSEVPPTRRRRGKRDKEAPSAPPKRKKRQSKALQKHKNDSPSGGIEVMLPSFIGIAILACGAMAKMGFRGRPSVAGIDLGTTNSVICVQGQTGADIVIDCIPDPASGSAVIPSVVSILEPHERSVGPSSKRPSLLSPHPSHVVVGAEAKQRIDSHPHQTLYHAKRVIGRPTDDPSVAVLSSEVEFGIEPSTSHEEDGVDFTIPGLGLRVSPQQVGSYVVDHLARITATALGHENVKSAVICVPAKFNSRQREETVAAFRMAGFTVTRMLEEPTAAALAYGLNRKEGVDYILVYDFGGGTLDLSLLHVSEGFVDVMGSDGDDLLGGSNFDDAVAQFLIERHRKSMDGLSSALELYKWEEDTIAQSCPILEKHPLCSVSSFHTIGEQFKIQLSERYGSSDDDLTVSSQCMTLPDGARTLDLSSIDTFCSVLEPLDLQIRMEEFERVSQPLFDRALAPITRLLQSYDMTSYDIDEIVMVGGTTRMPQIRNLVKGALEGSSMNTSIDPDLTVAYGAASVID